MLRHANWVLWFWVATLMLTVLVCVLFFHVATMMLSTLKGGAG